MLIDIYYLLQTTLFSLQETNLKFTLYQTIPSSIRGNENIVRKGINVFNPLPNDRVKTL